MKKLYTILFLSSLFNIAAKETIAQCTYRPVSLSERVNNAKYIVLGKVTDKETYIDQSTGNVNTLNKLEVKAWLKNQSAVQIVYIITLAGVHGNQATQVYPALQLDQQHDYILMLEDDNRQIDNKSFRVANPQSLQALTYADAQGCLVNENNVYKDYFDKTPKAESRVFDEINIFTRQEAKKPSGEKFEPRSPVVQSNRTMVIGSFSPSPTNGGTVVAGDYITITGSGFGGSPGTVFFSNSDDGGSTFTSTGVSSDIVSWSDGSITVKVAPNAGTGPINVNGAMTSGSNLAVQYNHIAINSTFSGFGSSTRQRYYHRNMNGLGGYTFVYNTTSGFSANASARAAFERALTTWRDNTLINWQASGTTSSGMANDAVSVVMFDASLPSGVLGRATSRFSGSSTGACNLTNTVWCVTEVDIQFYTDPPLAGYPWEYGPTAPSFTEYDFESVALHELGHGHGLGHIVNPGAVMHFAISNGSSARTLSANDIAGGAARVAYSTTLSCFNPAACGSGAMTQYSTLPLTMSSFTGERAGPTVDKLRWTTTHEQNTRGFYIQRSKDATSFNEIGFVAAAGNSNQLLNYGFTDRSAGPYAWFYRLRMVDLDGEQTYSATVFIDGDKNDRWKIWTDEKGDKVYLYYDASTRSVASLQIFSGNGQQILSRNLSAGSNEIDVAFLPRGIYHYKLMYEGKIVSGKLLLGNR